ncbi:MAG: beta-propeller domain-containing protein [Myxococcota bacterium]
MHRSLLWLVVLVVGGVGLSGCTNDPEVSPIEGLLVQARTCEEVLDAVHQDALAKVDLELESFITQEYYNGPPMPGVLDVDFGGVPVGAPAGPTNGAEGGGGAEAPRGFSDTNRQVADVDEADIVKVTDGGTKLYVIRGNEFHAFDSWPAADMSKAMDIEVEGVPIEMFVEGDRAVVFSSVFDLPGLRDEDPCGGVGIEPFADVDLGYYCGRPYLKTTVIALDGDAPSVVSEVYVDGYYTSSRRHGDVVRAIVQTNVQRPPTVPNLWEALYDNETYPETREEEVARARAWARTAKVAIAETTLEDWIPAWGQGADGEVEERAVQCSDFYTPAPGFTDYGMTQIVGIDLGDAGDVAITSILGSASQVYANADALILTQPDYAWYSRDTDNDRSAVHRFAVSADVQRTLYQGSGFVPGIVNDQFSIDERGGVVRVATTRTTWEPQQADQVWEPPTTDNLVTTMGLDAGELVVLGSTEPLAEGERIFSARFIGDLAYLVTFRQVDPLFAIDVSDPAAPRVLGELKIPGFSDYMHPLGDDHLLTIGRDIDEETQFDRGTALQIFDVSDPTSPRQAFKALVGDGFSEANHNHKAFNYYDELGILAFPFVSYESGFSSTLQLWDVSLDNGFRRRGEVDHSALIVEDCGDWLNGPDVIFFADFAQDCGYLPQVTRGVFIDEFIYSISHGGVTAHAIDNLGEPVATVTY